MTLLDEVATDLAGQSADDLLPPLRRGQGALMDRVVEAVSMGEGLALAAVALLDGRIIQVPLVYEGGWRRAEPSDGMSVRVLSAPEPLVATMLGDCPPIDGARERAVDVDMSNDVRIIDDKVVAKWQLVRDPESLAGPRLVAHLAAAGFTSMPEPVATVTWDGALVVAFTRFLPGAVDGWTWMLDDVRAFLDGTAGVPSWPALVGELTGEMHAAAATHTSVITDPITRSDLAALAVHYRGLLAEPLDTEMLTAIAPWRGRFAAACDILEAAGLVEVIPVHGDLHPGQFLRQRDAAALDRIVVSDFDGNPLLPAARRHLAGPSAYDVAGVLRGFDHVAIAAARRSTSVDAVARARSWARDAREQALAAYTAVPGGLQLHVEVLKALESLSPLHEAVYASAYLPRWRYVPLTVLTGGW